MSSTTTTWSTDTNTKSGSATTYTDTVSSLRLVGGEGEDAILRLFADEGDDNADHWRIVSQASTNKLNFMSLASGSWSNVMSLLGSGTAASQYLSLQTGNKLYLDGVGDTYIQESSADVLDIYVGGANMIKLTESTTDTVTITGQLTVGVDDIGHDVKFFGATATNGYMLWDESTDDLILGSSSKLGIGTTSPATMLDIAESSNGAGDAVIRLTGHGANSENTVLGRLEWYNGDASSDTPAVVSSIEGLSGTATGTGGKLAFFTHDGTEGGEGSADVVRMTIDETGNVGIGTDAPAATLHVKDAEVAGTVIIESSSTNTDNTAPEVKLLRSNTTNLSVDDDLGQIRFQGYDNAGTPAVFNYSGIMTSISNYTDGSEEGTLQFQVARGGTGAGGGTSTMTLKGANVGIGTAVPASMLEIKSATTNASTTFANAVADGIIMNCGNTVNDNDYFPAISWISSDGDLDSTETISAAITVRAAETFDAANDSGADMQFWTHKIATDADGPSLAMTILDSGNVGIGTASPDGQLHIKGDDDSDQVIIENTNANSNTAPDLVLYRSSASPADADNIGKLEFRGINDNSDDFNYGNIYVTADDVSDASEDSTMFFNVYGAGAVKSMVLKSGNVGIGTSSPGTLLEINGAALDSNTAPVEVLRLALTDAVDQYAGHGPSIDFRVGDNAESDNISADISGRIAVVKESATDANTSAAMGFWTGANQADATEKMRITSTGKVGIGDASPYHKLSVYEADGSLGNGIAIVGNHSTTNQSLGYLTWRNEAQGSDTQGDVAAICATRQNEDYAADLRFFVRTGGGALPAVTAPHMTIKSDGDVGIGTASPTDVLHVNDTNAAPDLLLSNYTSGGIDAGDILGRLQFGGSVNGTDFDVMAYIQGSADEDFTYNSNAGGELSFWTQIDGSSTAPSRRMTIKEDGKVGIGTADPSGLLDISSSTANKPILYITNTSTSQQAGGNLIFRNADTDTQLGDNIEIGDIGYQGWNTAGSDWETCALIKGRKDGATGGDNDMGGELAFYTSDDGSATVDPRMCIRHNGNVGIGVTAPDSLLHVESTFQTLIAKIESTHSTVTSAAILLDLDYSNDADVTGAYFCRFQDSGGEIGSIKSDGVGVDFNDTSDYRLKEDLQPVSDAIGTLNKLNIYNFKWKKTGKRRDGLLAHEVQTVVPYASSGEKDAMTTKKYTISPAIKGVDAVETVVAKDAVLDDEGNIVEPAIEAVEAVAGVTAQDEVTEEREVILPQQINHSKLVPLLIKAVQELSAKVTALENA